VLVSPQSTAVQAGERRSFRALPRDRNRQLAGGEIDYHWEFVSASLGCRLEGADQAQATLVAGKRLGLVRIRAVCTQGDQSYRRTAMITVAEHLNGAQPGGGRNGRRGGVPGYTFRHEPGRDWRSRLDQDNNLVVINNGHRDFVYAQKSRACRVRYIARLFSKELVLHHFPGIGQEELLERMVELSLYIEENLK